VKKYSTILLIFIAIGCVDPINLKIDGNGGTLVVDGWITDLPGPYTIRLSRSIPYDNSKPMKVYTIPEKNAVVTIVDNLGNINPVPETIVAGTYSASAVTGVPGRSYQLRITTTNGSQYHSTFDEIKPVPPIDALEYEYTVTETLFINANGAARTQKLEAFALYAVVSDPQVAENFYRWQVDGIFEFFSVSDFLPTHCWAPVTRLESKLVIADDEFTDGHTFRQYLANVPYDRPTYYLVKVRQQSLTREAFDFTKRISVQQTSTGTLFDPPPAPIIGNIVCDTNPAETVLGYFGASSVAVRNILINRFKESGYVNPSRYTPPKPGDCRTMQTNATNIRPEGFPP
jgi:hypothetical protein